MAKTYISAAESNHNSDVNERRKNRANRRNPKCPIEGHHSVVCPPWMDDPLIKRCMAEWGCDREDAIARLRCAEEWRD